MSTAATMDFFEHQDQARKRTSLLVGYYVLAVAMIILSVYLAFAAIFIGVKVKTSRRNGGVREEFSPERLWNPQLFAWVSLGTLAVVVFGTIYKMQQLSSGGAAVARMLGGRPVTPNTTDPTERKILNVVEEMAIASGTPVPPVFLLDEEKSINAFAAGFTPGDAVIGVTRGCVEQLSRDELQGVIAHEFSHILNGDMRLNLRLLGVLNGILVIALIGYGVFRASLYSSHRSSRSDRKGGGGAIVILGLCLMAIGYIGVLFGKLIKSAVSRQREYLADASAVQFTRNPEGLAGALKRIAGFSAGSRIQSPKAEEASHLVVSDGLGATFLNLMATHPPLDERIHRLDPSFTGQPEGSGTTTQQHSPAAPSSELAASGLAAPVSQLAIEPQAAVASVGTISAEHLAYARQVVDALPQEIKEAAREPSSARALVYGLLLSDDQDVRNQQLQHLEAHEDKVAKGETSRLAGIVSNLGARNRLPIADLAIAGLRQLSDSQFPVFKENVAALIGADREVDLFEYALQRMIMRHLEPVFSKPSKTTVRFHTIDSVAPTVGKLLSCLAYWGTEDVAEAQAAYTGSVAALGSARIPALLPVESCGLGTVDAALTQLAQAAPKVKRPVLQACITCVGADGEVTVEEADLLRAVADSMDCPMPPVLPTA